MSDLMGPSDYTVIRVAKIRAAIIAYLNQQAAPVRPGFILEAMRQVRDELGYTDAGVYWNLSEMAKQGLIGAVDSGHKGQKLYCKLSLAPKPPAVFHSHAEPEPVPHYPKAAPATAGLEVSVGGVNFTIDVNPQTGRRRVIIE
jgi:hypothetical protein